MICSAGRNLLIVSMVVFLATTVSMAPVEGKKTPHSIVHHGYSHFFSSSDLVLCLPEKEQEEVEVEAMEEGEGELSEEEEGRPETSHSSDLLCFVSKC